MTGSQWEVTQLCIVNPCPSQQMPSYCKWHFVKYFATLEDGDLFKYYLDLIFFLLERAAVTLARMIVESFYHPVPDIVSLCNKNKMWEMKK